MDSNIYLKISDKISDLFPEKLRELPLNLVAPDFNSTPQFLEDVKLFLQDAKEFLSIKRNQIDPLVLILIFLNHNIPFRKDIDDISKSNIIGFINLIVKDVLNSNYTNNKNTSPLNSSILCFILESSLFYGLCENRSEQHIKRASHILATNIIDQLYHIKENRAAIIIGYLKCSWYFAQKTEGIKDSEDQKFINYKNPIFLFNREEYAANSETLNSIFQIDI